MGFSGISFPYTDSGVVNNVPSNVSGVYGIFQTYVHGQKCIYIGRANDLLARLTQHVKGWSKEAPCIEKQHPTTITYEVVPSNALEREKQLYAEFKAKKEATCNDVAPS